MTRKLGKIQKELLKSLKMHNYWHCACGWVWDTPSGTERILETLVRRGLVSRKEERVNDRHTRMVYRLVDNA